MYGNQSGELVPGYSKLKGLNRGRVWKPWAGHTPTQTSLEWPPSPSPHGGVGYPSCFLGVVVKVIGFTFPFPGANMIKIINKPTTSESYQLGHTEISLVSNVFAKSFPSLEVHHQHLLTTKVVSILPKKLAFHSCSVFGKTWSEFLKIGNQKLKHNLLKIIASSVTPMFRWWSWVIISKIRFYIVWKIRCESWGIRATITRPAYLGCKSLSLKLESVDLRLYPVIHEKQIFQLQLSLSRLHF